MTGRDERCFDGAALCCCPIRWIASSEEGCAESRAKCRDAVLVTSLTNGSAALLRKVNMILVDYLQLHCATRGFVMGPSEMSEGCWTGAEEQVRTTRALSLKGVNAAE